MTSFQLKILALIAMTLDHTAAIIGQYDLFPNLPVHGSYILVRLMHAVGRIAFPIFAFLIAEGAEKTKSMPKYIGRLVLFAFLSEPVFFASQWRVGPNGPTIRGLIHNLTSLRWGNVFFTLALGAITIYAYQLLERKRPKHWRALFALAFLAALLFGFYIRCDYGLAGVLLVVGLFLARTKMQKCGVILVWTIGLYGFSQWYNPLTSVLNDCIAASASCVFVWLYNGKRGKNAKWSFYLFYPAHLLVLTVIHVLISRWTGGISRLENFWQIL